MAFDTIIKAGTTSKIIEVTLRDSTTGGGKTGVAHSSLVASYVREGGTRTAITLAAGSPGDAYSSGKWAEVDSTNCKGVYQLHVPNAALAANVAAVTIVLQASGVVDKQIRIALPVVNLFEDALRTNIVQIGGDQQSLTDFKKWVDDCYDPAFNISFTHVSNINEIYGFNLTDYVGTITSAATYFKRLDAAITSRQTAIWSSAAASVNLSGTTVAIVSAATLADSSITEAKFAVPAEAAGRPTGILGMLRRGWEWCTNRVTRDRSTGTMTLYGSDNTTVLEARTQSTTGTTDSISKGA